MTAAGPVRCCDAEATYRLAYGEQSTSHMENVGFAKAVKKRSLVPCYLEIETAC